MKIKITNYTNSMHDIDLIKGSVQIYPGKFVEVDSGNISTDELKRVRTFAIVEELKTATNSMFETPRKSKFEKDGGI